MLTPPEVTPEVIQTTTSSESDVDEKHKKKGRKKKKLKKMMEEGVFTTSTPDPKRKERSSLDTSPQPHSAKHRGFPQIIAVHKSQKQ